MQWGHVRVRSWSLCFPEMGRDQPPASASQPRHQKLSLASPMDKEIGTISSISSPNCSCSLANSRALLRKYHLLANPTVPL